MKIAIFKNMEFGFEAPSDESLEDCDNYIRLTEYVEVDFVRLENKEIVTKQVNVLKEAKKKIQAKAELQLEELDRQIGDLLALPHAI